VCAGPAAGGAGAGAIVIDGGGGGRTFDGIGGLSGGGATSRLLIDYPQQQQGEILDFLFKPGFGASLQILKVEIGADTDTTNGAEASHQRTPTDRNYRRGYEWWLMQQAKMRNPDIKLYGLEWGVPGWFSGGFFSQDNIDYVLDWIAHAQSEYGLVIDYVGCRNETTCDKTWLENLKAALVSRGLPTRVVAGDTVSWSIAASLASDSAYAAATDVVGAHYPCGYKSDGSNCGSDKNIPTAVALGKPLWATEQGSQRFDTGAVPMAREVARGYIQAKITASINWTAVASWYTNLPFAGVDGLIAANEPWSGHYDVDRELWTTAHVTQFAEPGWQFIDAASAVDAGVGSHLALRAPNGKDFTVFLETTDAKASTTFDFVQTGGVYEGPVHVWSTDLSSTTSSGWFVQEPDINPAGCAFSFAAAPNHVYTLSTTSGQSKGASAPPASAAWPLPYSDDFESYTVGAMPNIPRYLSAFEGAFEVENCAGGRAGKCVQQELTAAPIPWKNQTVPGNPVALVGDPGWTDYVVSVDVLLQQAGSVALVGRVKGMVGHGGGELGYDFVIGDDGKWSLFRQDATATTTLASGTVTFPLGSWHTMSLAFAGNEITASYDGATIGSATDAVYAQGNVAISSIKYNGAQFDNLVISAK
jgi:hypothetical protein